MRGGEYMLNQVMLIGRISDQGLEHEGELILTLAITRAYKNDAGFFETDFINCRLSDTIASKAAEYCTKGDLVGIKGTLTQDLGGATVVSAEKVTFLSSTGTSKGGD